MDIGETPAFPRFLAPLPSDLQTAVDIASWTGGSQLERQEWGAAFETFARVNRAMVAGQPQGKRFHKGTPLHNMGLARLLGGNRPEGFTYTLHAFVEDALSAGDERLSHDEEMRRPAANNLVRALGVAEGELRRLGIALRSLGAQELMPTPEAALASLNVNLIVREPEAPPQQPARVVGQFTSVWRDRVFIGGAYRLFANMSEIRKIVVANGFDAVMASDFDIPAELTHHHSLLLLHECRLAIFEVSVESGQLMELERTRDYEFDPGDVLVLAMAAEGHDPHPTGMVEALLGRLGIPPITYSDISQLPGIIGPWLAARG